MTSEELEYVEYLVSLSPDDLRKEQEYYEKELEDADSNLETTNNMINQFYDNPGMEHLLDMQIPSMSDNKLKKAIAQRKLLIINNLDKINKE